MAVNNSTLSLNISGTIYKTNQTPLVAVETLTDAGSPANVTRVEFQLMYGALGGQGGLRVPKKTVNVLAADANPTGTYTATFPATDFNDPGTYVVQTRVINESGGSVNVFLTDISSEFLVADLNQADKFNTLSDENKAQLDNVNRVKWESVTMTGAQLKASTGDNSGATKTALVSNIPSNATLVGATLTVGTADTGTASTTTATLGSNSSSFNDLLAATDARTAAATGVSTSFVPKTASSTTLKTLVTVTGSGKTIADIADSTSLTFNYGYVVPESKPFGV